MYIHAATKEVVSQGAKIRLNGLGRDVVDDLWKVNFRSLI
jgi:hypothetical protein